MKKILVSFLAIALCSTAFAAASFLQGVKLSINSRNGLYEKGEEVVFTVNRTDNPAQQYRLTVYEECLVKLDSVIAIPQGESVIYSFSSQSPKTVTIRVSDVENGKLYQEVAATVDPYGYETGFDEPADFVPYWKDQLKKMRKVKPVAKLTPVESKSDGVKVFDLEVSMHEGRPVRGYLAIPEGVRKKSLPAILLLHGAGVNKPGNRASIKEVVKYAKMGCMALDINAHGMLNDQPQEYYDDLEHGEMKSYRTRTLTTREDYYFRLMVLRAVRAVDYLCSRPEWDGKRMIAQGGSQGGYQAAAAAGLNRKVSLAIINNPAHTDLAGPRKGRKNAWPGAYNLSLKRTPELTDSILPYFDGAMFLRHASCKVIVTAGLTDPVCPAGSVLSAYNVCPSKDKMLYTYPYLPHGANAITEKARRKEYNEMVNNPKDNFLKEYISGKKDRSAVVYLIGDSTCANYKESSRPRYGWGEKFQAYLDGFKVDNRATSGRSTKSFISEGRWDSVMENLKAGDYVFIQFGHNDEKLNDPKRGTEPFGEFYDNLCRFISETRSKGAVPVLLTPVCRRAFNSDGTVRFTHKEYPAAMKKAGKDTGTYVIDMEHLTALWLESAGKEQSAKFFMYSVNGKDNTHFTEQGAEYIAATVARELKISGEQILARLAK